MDTPFLINPATLRQVPGFEVIPEARLDAINANLHAIVIATIRQEQSRLNPVKLDLAALARETFAVPTPERSQ